MPADGNNWGNSGSTFSNLSRPGGSCTLVSALPAGRLFEAAGGYDCSEFLSCRDLATVPRDSASDSCIMRT